MTKHTQWEVVEIDDVRTVIQQFNGYDEIICKDVGTHADGKLIASAPALLEACKTALGYVDWDYKEDKEIVDKLQQAINQTEEV